MSSGTNQSHRIRPVPARLVFVCGAHFDQIFRLKQPAVLSSSNPALVSTTPGGTSLNCASTAAILDLQSALLSPIGEDADGKSLQSVCLQRNIEPFLSVISRQPTGVYGAIIEPDGNVLIGAAGLEIYEALPANWIDETLAKIAGPQDGLFVTTNLSRQHLLNAINYGSYLAAATVSRAKATRLVPILEHIDFLFSNLAEARNLASLPDATARQCAEKLMSLGVVSGTISEADNPLTWWYGAELGQTPTPPQPIVSDTNGAGDVLAGAILATLSKGRSFERAIEVGLAAASLCVATSGPYPNPTSLKTLISELN